MTIAMVVIATTAMGQNVEWTSSTQHVEGDTYRIILQAKIPQGYHLYDMGPYEGGPTPTSFVFAKTEGVKFVGDVKQLSTPHRAFNPLFNMEIGTFDGEARFAQDFLLAKEQATLKVELEWMICNDENCLPPTDEEMEFNVSKSTATPASKKEVETISQLPSNVPERLRPTPAVAQKDEISLSQQNTAQKASTPRQVKASNENAKSLWALILEAVAWGFVALLTPCVFPMVPMTVSFFMKSSGSVALGRLRAMLYGVFIVALYTLPIAAIILITRLVGGDAITADIFNWLATHWLPNVIFFLVFMIFAASFFGAFEITMPSWMVNKSDSKADSKGLAGIFFMALTLVLVSFSCTGPIVGSVLIKSTEGEFWNPIITMLAFSIAFALPFTLFAFFPSMLKKMPKSGGWLNSVKVVLGFIEVALGLKFLSVADQTYHWGLLDREIYLAIWIATFSLLGLYLLGKLRFAHDSEMKSLGVGRLFLAIITFSFVVYLIPGMWGAPLKGLSGYLPPIATQDFVMTQGQVAATSTTKELLTVDGRKPKHSDFLHVPQGLQGFFDIDEAQAYARKVGKPLFVDFTGHGCVNCREMEARVWSDPEVVKMLNEHYVLVALYADDKKELPEEEWVTTSTGKVLKEIGKINSHYVLQTYGANAQPYYILQGRNGETLVEPRGYDLSVEGFLDFLRRGVKAYQDSLAE